MEWPNPIIILLKSESYVQQRAVCMQRVDRASKKVYNVDQRLWHKVKHMHNSTTIVLRLELAQYCEVD